MTFRFPSDSPASVARRAAALERERAARMPKTTRGTVFEDRLREMGHPAAKIGAGPTYQPPKGAPKRCPTCNSHSPALHPAVQHGGEVHICPDPWHGPLPDYAKPKDERGTPPQDPRAQEQAALVAEYTPKKGDRVEVRNASSGAWVAGVVEGVAEHTRDGQKRTEIVIHMDAGCYYGWTSEFRPLPTSAERAQSGGWIEWGGGTCPVTGEVRVEVKRADGGVFLGGNIRAANEWRSRYPRSWAHTIENQGYHIVAYKVLQP